MDAGDLELDLAVEHVLMGRTVGVEGADILPIAVAGIAEHRLAVLQQLRKYVAGEIDGPIRFDVVEDLRFEDIDPGIDGVAEDLAPGRLLEEALDRPVRVGDDNAELERVLHGLQADGCDGALLLVELDDGRQVDVGDHVAGDDEEPLLQLVLGVAHRSGGAERRLLGGVLDAHAELGPVAEVGAHVVGHEGHGDDEVVEPVILEEADDVLHHRPVDQRHHGFLLVRGQWPQPAPLTARHDDRFHGPDPTRPSINARRAIGM